MMHGGNLKVISVQ